MSELISYCPAFPEEAKIELCNPDMCDCMTNPHLNLALIKGENK